MKIWQAPNGEDYEVVEANVGTMIHVTQEDVDAAVAKDPYHCALAQHCRRVLNSPEAMIAETVAYIVTKRRNKYVAVKYSVPLATRRAIRHFDETGEMPAEGFELLAIPPYMKGTTIKKRNQAFYAANAEKLRLSKRQHRKNPRKPQGRGVSGGSIHTVET